jgi:predicted nucleic acid-binding protein
LRCVFDTNVLVSSLLLPDSKPRQALDKALREGKVLVSFAALAELYEVLSRKQFRRYVDEEEVRSFLAALKRRKNFGTSTFSSESPGKTRPQRKCEGWEFDQPS